jgi:hypothetical protein
MLYGKFRAIFSPEVKLVPVLLSFRAGRWGDLPAEEGVMARYIVHKSRDRGRNCHEDRGERV